MDFILPKLEASKSKNLFRELKPVLPLDSRFVEKQGRKLLNFSSNDYLGLAKHPTTIQQSLVYTSRYGVGSTASRLVAGDFPIHEHLEQKIAALKNKETALLFNSGYQLNTSILQTLGKENVIFYLDKLAHNSLIQGAVHSEAKWKRFRHNDYEHLEKILAEDSDNTRTKFIISESVFSMDGDTADLKILCSIAKQYGAFLIIDEAHATGVLGEGGRGLTINHDVDIVLGTFGKALGSFGAYVACSQEFKEYLLNFCSGLIFTTSLPPSVIGAVDAAIDLIPSYEIQRRKLQEMSNFARSEMQNVGISTGNSSTQIIPIILGEEKKTLDCANYLEKNGILCIAIRPPTVEKNRSRLRVALSSEHTDEDIRLLTQSIKNFLNL